MVRKGKKPFHECSTRGDRRFSAFVARPSSLNGRSIEEAYQAAKIFRDGSTNLPWRQAKGRAGVTNREECAALYKELWREYLNENPALFKFLLQQSGLSDMFGSPGSVCQATTLWELCEEHRRQNPDA